MDRIIKYILIMAVLLFLLSLDSLGDYLAQVLLNPILH
jgi:hypothetical protein